jgi:hypothetical protein
MSELLATRIREAARRLHLGNLTPIAHGVR